MAGPVKGVYYDVYVMIDIYSRYIVGVRVHPTESGKLAADMMAQILDLHGTPTVVHADRGTSMTSKTVAQLLGDLDVTRSLSRPKVSNPFSEAQFKTLKYIHDFPHHFDSLAEARAFCDGFFTEYNHVHRHSGIGWHTPASVHYGTYGAIDDACGRRRQVHGVASDRSAALTVGTPRRALRQHDDRSV